LANGEDGWQILKITILVEGKTEIVFKSILREFLELHLEGKMPRLDFFPYDGRIPKENQLKNKVKMSLANADHVIALTDVYTGTNDFSSAEDAKSKMRKWVGEETRFSPHVALHDFEAWLIPYWSEILKLAKHNKKTPGIKPESINHGKPPSKHIVEIFQIGKISRSYSKTRDATRILNGKDLRIAIDQCPELKEFVNTIIRVSGGNEIA
jgi:hypothetical protein